MQRAKPILAAALGAVVLLAGCADGDSISGPEPAGPSFAWCDPETCEEPQPGADTLPPPDDGPIEAAYEYGSLVGHNRYFDYYHGDLHNVRLHAFSDAQSGVATVGLEAYMWDTGRNCGGMTLLFHGTKTEPTNNGSKRLAFSVWTESQPRRDFYGHLVGVGGKVTASHTFTPATGFTGGGSFASEASQCYYWY